MKRKSKSRESSAKKGRTHTKVNDILLNLDPFKGIFERIDKNKDQIMCVPCTDKNKRSGSLKQIVIYYENLETHIKTAMHKSAIASKSNEIPFIEEVSQKKEKITEKRSCKSNYKLQITAFLLKNNLPFKLAAKLDDFFKRLLDDFPPRLITSYNITREDASEIANEHIGRVLKNKLLADLERTYFSISIDEATIQKTEYLAVNARYLEDENSIHTVTKLIALVQLGKSGTGETLYNIITDLLFTGSGAEDRRKNFMGISTDGAAKMIGSGDKNVASRLKKEIPHMIAVHDFCHALNLVLSNSLDPFPADYKKIIETISKTFSHSPQRNDLLRECILELKKTGADIDLLVVKQYTPTRWTSLKESLDRILYLWSPLKLYFEEKATHERDKTLFTQQNMAMLKLLQALVNIITRMIKEFESNNIETFEIVKMLKEYAISLGKYIFHINPIEIEKSYKLLEPYLTDTTGEYEYSLSFRLLLRSPEEFKNLIKEKYPNISDPSSCLEGEALDQFYQCAFQFFEKAMQSLRKYLPWRSDQIIMLADAFLLTKEDQDQAVVKLNKLAKYFTNIISAEDQTLFADETSRLESKIYDLQQSLGRKQNDYLEVWKDTRMKFPLIYRLARAIAVLPYSTADIERSFSIAGIIKNEQRNRLSTDRIEASLLAKQYFGKKEQYYTEEMLNSYLDQRKYEKTIEKSKSIEQLEDQIRSEVQMAEEKPNDRCFILVTPSQEDANKMVQEMMIGYRTEEKNQLKRQISSPLPIRTNLKQFKPLQTETSTIQYQKDEKNNHESEMRDEKNIESEIVFEKDQAYKTN
jgi:hypothetical protein